MVAELVTYCCPDIYATELSVNLLHQTGVESNIQYPTRLHRYAKYCGQARNTQYPNKSVGYWVLSVGYWTFNCRF